MNRLRSLITLLTLLASCLAIFGDSQLALGQSEFRLRDICRLKGQEENVLQGIGLVVGLKGTGDGLKTTSRGLAQTIKLLGGQVGADLQGQLNEKELEGAKNVAVVVVTARVPPAGAQPGEKLACTVSALNAKSLEGGNLMQTPLIGPRTDKAVVYALASGPLQLENPRIPTTARIENGCKMEAEVKTNFVENNAVTLVLEPAHSSFTMAEQVENAINTGLNSLVRGLNESSGRGRSSSGASSGATAATSLQSATEYAKAVDQSHVRVQIPELYQSSHVAFVSDILNFSAITDRDNRRVVIREREGVIVCGEDVTIAPLAFSHKNVTISTRGSGDKANKSFKGLGYERQASTGEKPTLQSLLSALNTLALTTEDQIAILKTINSQGNLFGELIIE